ncbi:SNF2 family ATP-dependent chromatin-remodeling factor snf21 [Pyrenophora tritici-repentis Pt-1C-BFP]|uniref:SNF2 family ATP-dependent chromatin-remodeling factor snf21 n=1 Tax=Pyrenophora tritici-repentis (strain Pt-1C-BFP) TaxID=426418 RepID=B2VV70_PYRTR|nr:SNF2 family ATP-dependent chromatin-remodeling factor snf21 [Pyrenophora tritici-repentis Pt-1C-BFP]EDU40575.1 SNF2 family ATP-dependent chromatin-remodeling factor snf21 [Pyrenophora tritici-repentis Pt-1C-BFP]
MASVQANPEMPGQGQLPGNITREQIQHVFQRYTAMKAQGVPETNPEFIKARNLLSMVQKQNQYQQQQKMLRQQQMQRQQGQMDPQNAQLNGAGMGMANGTKPATPADAKVTTPMPASTGPSSTMQVATAGGQTPAGDGQTPTSATAGSMSLSKDQLLMLRAQIGAFKHLSKGLPLPSNMQQQIFGHHQAKKPQNAADAVAAASQMLDNATRAGSTSSATGGAVQETRPLPRLPDTFIDPWSSEAFRDVNYISHTQRKNRPYLATIMPQQSIAPKPAFTEKLEKQQRRCARDKEKEEAHEFIDAIRKHRTELQEAGAAQRIRLQKLGRLMITTHQNIEKEEQKRIERTAKQRLQALNQGHSYLTFAQADRWFLEQLADSVKAQQRSANNSYEPEPESETSDAESGDEDKPGKKKTDYYEIAHRVKEEVTQQASNLVGGTLKEYQLKGLQWMISLYNNNLNGILADEMGLGKTIQTISLITYLIEKKRQPGPYLVIVPLSTLTNWTNEFEKWAPSVTKIVYKGPPNSRKQYQQQIRWGQFQVLLTTYEFIIKDRPVLSKIKWVHMIVDEGHRMKNAGSKLSMTITQYYTTRYRLILTGTPLQNNLTELWAMLNFVLPTIFKSATSFDEWFNTPFANTGGQDKMELTEEEQLLVIRRLHKVLRPFLLRRLKRDVEKDLPDKTERVIKCNFSTLQAKLYKQLVTHNRLMVSDGKGGKTGMRGLSNMLMQLRKLCNHPFVFEEVEDVMNPTKGTNDLLWRAAGKFELLDRILPKFQATGHRVLMFFQMTQIMNIMEDYLRLRGMMYLRLDGATKADDRSDLLRLFNAPDSPYFCFLLSTRAGGLGLNLQTADTVIIYDSDWNPHQDLQAQDRAHRIGQKNEVRILRLITSNSVEEKILERANYKLDMDGKVIQAGKFDNKSKDDERDAMLRIMLESAEAAESLEQEEMDDDDLNQIMMRHDHELVTFQEMDRKRIAEDPYGPGKPLGRLIGESELPDIYLNEEAPIVDEKDDTPAGRGARERTRVKYDDGLTEEQWLEAVDNDEDTIEAAIARKEAKVAKRGRKSGGRPEEDSPVPSRASSEEPMPKKRGRKPKAEKRKADEASLDAELAPRKRGRPAPTKDMLHPDQRASLQKVVNIVYEALNDLEEESQDPNIPNRGIIDPFIELPDKWDYPDYYQLIKNPICMKQIEKKINKKEYQSVKQFRQDLGLLCNNCRTYNEDTSLLFADANLIEQTALDKLREATAEFPEWQDYDDGGSVHGGASTAMTSAVGTPRGGL